MDINNGDAGENIFCDRNMFTSRSYVKLTIDYQMNILFGVILWKTIAIYWQIQMASSIIPEQFTRTCRL